MMFGDLLNRLFQPDPDTLPEPDARLAMTALLVRVARTDGTYSESEIARIDRICEARYTLTASAAAELRARAEVLEDQAPDTVRFTRAIKDAVPYGERRSVVEALWEVALADGQRDSEEDALLRLVASLLGVSDVDSALARQRAERD
jgi:uncharacterized tellurite resistance protein B-like protein